MRTLYDSKPIATRALGVPQKKAIVPSAAQVSFAQQRTHQVIRAEIFAKMLKNQSKPAPENRPGIT